MVRTLRLQAIHVKHYWSYCLRRPIWALDCHVKCKAFGSNSAFRSSYQSTFTSHTRITPDCRLTSDLVLRSKFQIYQREIWNFQLSFLLEQCLACQVYIRPLQTARLCVFVSKVQPVFAKHIKNLWSPVLIPRLRMAASICSYANLEKISRKVPPWDDENLKSWIFTEIGFVCSFQLFYFLVFFISFISLSL